MENYKILSLIRKERNLKAKDAAKLLNADPTTLSSYERGINEPPIDTLLNLSKIYKVSIDYLISGQEFKISFKNEEIESFLKYLIFY